MTLREKRPFSVCYANAGGSQARAPTNLLPYIARPSMSNKPTKKLKQSAPDDLEQQDLLEKVSKRPALALQALMEFREELERSNATATVTIMTKIRSRVEGTIAKNRKLTKNTWKLVDKDKTVGSLSMGFENDHITLEDFWIDECGPYGICNSKCEAQLEFLAFEAQIKLLGDIVDVTIEIDNRGKEPAAFFTCNVPFEAFEDGGSEIPDYNDLRLVADEDSENESDS